MPNLNHKLLLNKDLHLRLMLSRLEENCSTKLFHQINIYIHTTTIVLAETSYNVPWKRHQLDGSMLLQNLY